MKNFEFPIKIVYSLFDFLYLYLCKCFIGKAIRKWKRSLVIFSNHPVKNSKVKYVDEAVHVILVIIFKGSAIFYRVTSSGRFQSVWIKNWQYLPQQTSRGAKCFWRKIRGTKTQSKKMVGRKKWPNLIVVYEKIKSRRINKINLEIRPSAFIRRQIQ